MKKVYCISGLGADERVFGKLQVPGIEWQYLQWLMPEPNENMSHYAKRMSDQVADENAALIGVSFGGMMAIEIARHITVSKTILVSSIKSRKELPKWMKISGRLKLNRLVPPRPWKWLSGIENNFLGAQGPEEQKLANEFRQSIDPVYLAWAIGQVLNWQNEWAPPALYHIHGTGDKTFPIKNIQPTHIIKGGGHFMVMNRAEEISGVIGGILSV